MHSSGKRGKPTGVLCRAWIPNHREVQGLMSRGTRRSLLYYLPDWVIVTPCCRRQRRAAAPARGLKLLDLVARQGLLGSLLCVLHHVAVKVQDVLEGWD